MENLNDWLTKMTRLYMCEWFQRKYILSTFTSHTITISPLLHQTHIIAPIHRSVILIQSFESFSRINLLCWSVADVFSRCVTHSLLLLCITFIIYMSWGSLILREGKVYYLYLNYIMEYGVCCSKLLSLGKVLLCIFAQVLKCICTYCLVYFLHILYIHLHEYRDSRRK